METELPNTAYKTLVRLKESAYKPTPLTLLQTTFSHGQQERAQQGSAAAAWRPPRSPINGSELLTRTSEGRARIVRTTTARIGP